jgi:3',5'-cyclic AMP phosphodiesterase CpdA
MDGTVAGRGEVASVLIAQITDTHITRDGAQADYLAGVLAKIMTLDPLPTALVLSGDTVHHGRPEQYAILRDVLARCSIPVYAVPGNHDSREAFRDVLPATHFPGVSGERVHYVVDRHPVRLVGLDTSEPRRPGGYLDAASLAWLEATLAAEPTRPTLIFMHHPPFRTGVNAADLFGFKGGREFRRIVARHAAVRRIVAGHVHCERRATIGQAIATSGISTAPQQVPELFERRLLGFRPETPGFTLHAWSGAAFVSTTLINAGAHQFVERAQQFIDRPAPNSSPTR